MRVQAPLIGHGHAWRLLLRTAQEGEPARAYLFAGPPSVGKRTLALHFAQALNCASRSACGACAACRRIAHGTFTDLMEVDLLAVDEGDTAAKNIKIDQIRDLGSWLEIACYEGRYKVGVINGAERMSEPAANAFLKTLEEPPPHAVLILLTADEAALLPTVRSRCLRVRLSPVGVETLAAALAALPGVDPEQAQRIARAARGRPGWALQAVAEPGLLEQREQALRELLQLAQGSVVERFAAASDWANRFRRRRQQVEDLLLLWREWWRDVLLMRYNKSEYVVNIGLSAELAARSEAYTIGQIVQTIRRLEAAIQQLRDNVNPRLALEALLLHLPD